MYMKLSNCLQTITNNYPMDHPQNLLASYTAIVQIKMIYDSKDIWEGLSQHTYQGWTNISNYYISKERPEHTKSRT